MRLCVKTCTKCQETKPLDQFLVDRGRWLRASCRSCCAAYNAKYYAANKAKLLRQQRCRVYGVEWEAIEALHTAQNGKCAICPTTLDLDSADTNIDHCHDTGRVRGLLCSLCNRGLGFFRDSPDNLAAAAKYLSG